MLRKDANSITKVAIHWTPEGKWKRDRPKKTWQRTVEAEMKNMNLSWGSIQWLASDRDSGGGNSLLPYMPTGVTGSDDNDDDDRRPTEMCITGIVVFIIICLC